MASKGERVLGTPGRIFADLAHIEDMSHVLQRRGLVSYDEAPMIDAQKAGDAKALNTIYIVYGLMYSLKLITRAEEIEMMDLVYR